MEWTDTALVLAVGKFKEADLWVRLLGMQQGMVTAFAFGGSRSRRRFTGCLDTFNLILTSATLSRNGAFINLREATLLEGPSRLRSDWQRQGMAANCIRFVEALGVPPGSAVPSFQLLKHLFALLETAAAVPHITPLLFRFRMASDQGYCPDLASCSRCGAPLAPQGAVFQISEGYALCPSCGQNTPTGLNIEAEPLDLLRKVQEYSPDAWSDFALSALHWRQAARFIDAFIRYHLGLEWHNGRFIR